MEYIEEQEIKDAEIILDEELEESNEEVQEEVVSDEIKDEIKTPTHEEILISKRNPRAGIKG